MLYNFVELKAWEKGHYDTAKKGGAHQLRTVGKMDSYGHWQNCLSRGFKKHHFKDINGEVNTYPSYCLQTHRHNVLYSNLDLTLGYFCSCQNLSWGQILGIKMATTTEKFILELSCLDCVPKAEFKFNFFFSNCINRSSGEASAASFVSSCGEFSKETF